MKVAYVSGKYRAKSIHQIVKNIDAAADAALELWQAGFAVICPHKNSGLMDGAVPDDVWLKGDIELLRRADFMVMVAGWRDSQGAQLERLEAFTRGVPVYESVQEAIEKEQF